MMKPNNIELLNGPLLIEPNWFARFTDTLKSLATTDQANYSESMVEIVGSLGIIKLHNMLMPSANFYTEMGWATSLSEFRENMSKLASDKTIETILIDTNSPGGSVVGVSETSELVAKINQSKPVISYTHSLNASAAYWITSAATELYADRMSLIGSIGVVTSVPTLRNQYDHTFTNSESPNKRPDPETEEGKKVITAELDDIADFFIKAVAKNRGVERETVTNDFGKGGTLIAQKAHKAGMIDGVASFENIVKKYSTIASKTKTKALNSNGGKVMTLDELKAQHPDLVQQIEDAAKASADSINTDLKKTILGLNERLEASTTAQKDVTDRLLALEKENQKRELVAKTLQVEQQTKEIIAASLKDSNIPAHFHKKIEGLVDNSKFISEDITLDVEKFQEAVKAEITEFEGLLSQKDQPVEGLRTGDAEAAAVDADVDRLMGYVLKTNPAKK